MAWNMDKTNDASGMWSPVTAHMDWCEENYYMTFYVAEFWNTITNITMIMNALIGLRQASKDRTEKRHLYFYVAMLVTGIGSWCYHGTLRYTMHMGDEIPMLWLSAVGIYSMWEVNESPKKLNVAVFISLLIATTGASIATALFSKVIFFHITFAIYMFTYLLMSVHAAITKDCNPRYLKLAGFWLFMAFSVWLVDRNKCPELRSVRYGLPSGAQFLLQFHAWWHIFSNLGCAFNILFVYDMRSRYLRHKTTSKLKWGLFPYMEVNVSQKDMP